MGGAGKLSRPLRWDEDFCWEPVFERFTKIQNSSQHKAIGPRHAPALCSSQSNRGPIRRKGSRSGLDLPAPRLARFYLLAPRRTDFRGSKARFTISERATAEDSRIACSQGFALFSMESRARFCTCSSGPSSSQKTARRRWLMRRPLILSLENADSSTASPAYLYALQRIVAPGKIATNHPAFPASAFASRRKTPGRNR